jgi:diguanylate cyclase (GGDEF)-like protein
MPLVDQHRGAVVAGTRSARDAVPDAAQLAASLQVALELPQLIEVLAVYLHTELGVDGIRFRAPGKRATVSVGGVADHSCAYELRVSDQHLGTVVVMRRKPFGLADIERLELMMSGLLYPLRNALAYEQARQAALIDHLTGALNRAAMTNMLDREIGLAERNRHSFAVALLDVDHFKFINDSYGHGTGDVVLRNVVERIHDCMRETDSVFRYGGEEFVLLMPDADVFQALVVAERIRRALEAAPVTCAIEAAVAVRISAGVAAWGAGDSTETLLVKADQALYCAKRGGRNQVQMAAARDSGAATLVA